MHLQKREFIVPELHVLETVCEHCEAKIRVKTRASEKEIECPKCRQIVTVTNAPEVQPIQHDGSGHIFQCSNCRSKNEVGPEHIGSMVICHDCDQETVVTGVSPLKTSNWKTRAEAIVREVAEECKASTVIKRLSKFPSKAILNAKMNFAHEMSPDEIPLVFLDRSFFQNGKAGLLLTNLRLYSSTKNRSVDLKSIYAVTVELPDDLPKLSFTPKGPMLVVNGTVMFKASFNHHFWVNVLNRLSAECKATLKAPTNDNHGVAPFQDEKQLSRYVAASICAGVDRETMIKEAMQSGASRSKLESMIDSMRQLHTSPRSQKAALIVLMGILFIFGGIASYFSSEGRFIWTGGFYVGIPMFCIGMYRLLISSPPLNTADLIVAWDKINARHQF